MKKNLGKKKGRVPAKAVAAPKAKPKKVPPKPLKLRQSVKHIKRYSQKFTREISIKQHSMHIARGKPSKTSTQLKNNLKEIRNATIEKALQLAKAAKAVKTKSGAKKRVINIKLSTRIKMSNGDKTSRTFQRKRLTLGRGDDRKSITRRVDQIFAKAIARNKTYAARDKVAGVYLKGVMFEVVKDVKKKKAPKAKKGAKQIPIPKAAKTRAKPKTSKRGKNRKKHR